MNTYDIKCKKVVDTTEFYQYLEFLNKSVFNNLFVIEQNDNYFTLDVDKHTIVFEINKKVIEYGVSGSTALTSWWKDVLVHNIATRFNGMLVFDDGKHAPKIIPASYLTWRETLDDAYKGYYDMLIRTVDSSQYENPMVIKLLDSIKEAIK